MQVLFFGFREEEHQEPKSEHKCTEDNHEETIFLEIFINERRENATSTSEDINHSEYSGTEDCGEDLGCHQIERTIGHVDT